jgi:membrane protein
MTVASVLFSILDSLIAPERSLPDFDLIVVLVTVTFVFSLIYKFLPEVKMAWRDVLPGGLLAAALITIGGKLVELFLAGGRFTSALDAAGAFAMILILFYYVAQVFLLGAVFIRVLSNRFGSVEPGEIE